MICFLLSQQHGVLKIVQLGGVPLFGVVFCVVVVGQEKQSKNVGKGSGYMRSDISISGELWWAQS